MQYFQYQRFKTLIMIPSLDAGGLQDGAASASGTHHRLLRPVPRSRAEPGILPCPGPLPPLHCPLPAAAACHLWPAPPGHADPHRPIQSHIQEGMRSLVSLKKKTNLRITKQLNKQIGRAHV